MGENSGKFKKNAKQTIQKLSEVAKAVFLGICRGINKAFSSFVGFIKRIFLKKWIRRTFIVFISFCLLVGVAALSMNLYVIKSVDENILSVEDASKLENVDCVIVLGCGINSNGTPSDMLRDRLNFAIELYKNGGAPKLLMSGDHGRVGYNEVGVMKQYAIDKGVPSEDIFMDHAGFSTYETMYRANEIFEASKVIVVTQEYHLYRGMYNAEKMGMETYGVASDVYWYQNKAYREIREAIARCKDFLWCVFKPEPTYLGDSIPVSGNGDSTNDY
jgi:vancomycin permeability regulator SanA